MLAYVVQTARHEYPGIIQFYYSYVKTGGINDSLVCMSFS